MTHENHPGDKESRVRLLEYMLELKNRAAWRALQEQKRREEREEGGEHPAEPDEK